MAPSLKMVNGLYCVLSLRTTTLILACFNLFVSGMGIYWSEILFYREYETPDESLHEDFNLELPERTTETPELEHHGSTTVDPEVLKELQDFRVFLIVSMITESINSILALVDVVLTIALIYGAVRMQANFIRPWLFVGGFMIAYDFVLIVVHLAIGMHFPYTLDIMAHIPLVSYLWVVAWNLFEDCRDVDRRTNRSPISMSALTACGPEDAEEPPCSVPYSAFGKA